MKKLILSILALILLIPTLVNADETTCDIDTINSLKEQIKDVTFDLEYVPEGTEVKTDFDDAPEKIDSKNIMKVITNNLPENFYILLYESESNISLLHSDYITLIPGGVYEIQIYSEMCQEDILKKYQIMIPIYDLDNKNDIWFDGTYNHSSNKESSKNNKVQTRLVIILIILLIIICSFTFIVIRSRRHKK